jgi:hypothetical protein
LLNHLNHTLQDAFRRALARGEDRDVVRIAYVSAVDSKPASDGRFKTSH